MLSQVNPSFKTLSPGAPEAIKKAFGELQGVGVEPQGDYYEFGLFRGATFLSAQKICDELGLKNVNFNGFDSFDGLPPVTGIDKTNNLFYEGQFKCARDEVIANLTSRGFDWSRAHLVEGCFSDSLTDEAK